MEDWGCVTEKDLFGGVPISLRSLDDIVDGLRVDKEFTQIGVESLKDLITPMQDDNVEIHRCDNVNATAALAPKILKKKRQNSTISPPPLKKVKFEVEKLVITEGLFGEEKEAARKRMAISLGAVPEKGKYVNYKKMKEEGVSTKKETCPNFSQTKKKKPRKFEKRKNFEVA